MALVMSTKFITHKNWDESLLWLIAATAPVAGKALRVGGTTAWSTP